MDDPEGHFQQGQEKPPEEEMREEEAENKEMERLNERANEAAARDAEAQQRAADQAVLDSHKDGWDDKDGVCHVGPMKPEDLGREQNPFQEGLDKLNPLNGNKGGENADTELGRQKHQEFSEKAEAKGWQTEPRLTDPLTGKTVKPDAVTKTGKPVELKPNTKSGRAAGKSQLRKYERATGKQGRVVYYDKNKKQP